jgi:hypothetical protein
MERDSGKFSETEGVGRTPGSRKFSKIGVPAAGGRRDSGEVVKEVRAARGTRDSGEFFKKDTAAGMTFDRRQFW